MSRHVLDRLGDHLEGDLTPEEFAQVDAHLDECSSCAAELRELRETVALLRGLPDPVPPPRLAADVMQRIAAEDGSGGRVIELFREVAQPRVVAALAAGIAALALFSTLDIGVGGLLGPSSDPNWGQIVKNDVPTDVPVTGAEGASRPRSLPRVPATSDLIARSPVTPTQRMIVDPAAPRFSFVGRADPEVPLRDLDAEFDALMANPQALLERVRRTSASERRPMFAPLVEHSARRGDVDEINRMLSRATGPPMAVPASTAR